MPSNYPTSLDSFTDPTSGSSLASPSHSGQHIDLNDAVEKLEAKLGIGSSPASSAVNGAVLQANGSGSTTWTANAVGLWLVKSQTIGTAVTSVTVSSVFNSDFDHYLITVDNTYANVGGNLFIQFGSTTTGYYGSQYFDFYTGAATGTNRVNNGAANRILALGTVADTSCAIHCYGPFTATRTIIHGTFFGGGFSGFVGGQLANTTSYTAFTLFGGDGVSTFTGGTINVYGYRK